MRGFLKALSSRGATKIVALAKLEGIPLLGGIVALIHRELVLVLAWVVAVSILADVRAFPLIRVIAPAIGHL